MRQASQQRTENRLPKIAKSVFATTVVATALCFALAWWKTRPHPVSDNAGATVAKPIADDLPDQNDALAEVIYDQMEESEHYFAGLEQNGQIRDLPPSLMHALAAKIPAARQASELARGEKPKDFMLGTPTEISVPVRAGGLRAFVAANLFARNGYLRENPLVTLTNVQWKNPRQAEIRSSYYVAPGGHTGSDYTVFWKEGQWRIKPVGFGCGYWKELRIAGKRIQPNSL